jgi:coenzyme PQQ precursor peptide PqqA
MKSSRHIGRQVDLEVAYMAWTKPTLKEIACGMEINMYAPAEDEPVLF